MFCRHITYQLNPEYSKEFPVMIEEKILPLLKKQKGFLDELVLMTPSKNEVIALSLWEEKAFAETYNREFYPEIVKILDKFTVGSPVMKTFEVQAATFRKVATPAFA